MKVAVRSLCEFAARNGSLEFRYTPSPTAEEGIRGHQKLQKRRVKECGPDVTYEPEHLLEGHIQGIDLKGRADGYLSPVNPTDSIFTPLLEEIKTHRGELDRIGDGQRQLHLAQLKVYGALLCLRDKRSAVRLRLVYYDIDRDQESPDESLWQASVLIPFAEDLCRQYANWHRQEAEHRLQRDSALQQLEFPYPEFRPHQRALSEAVYKGIFTRRQLLLEAPTGLGKTLGVSFPALKAMAKCGLDRLFLLSSRTTGRQLFMDALKQLSGYQPSDQKKADHPKPEQALGAATQNAPILPVRILELSAKEKSCEHPDKACHGDSCPLAEGFFDRLPQARQAAAQSYWLDQPQIRRIALEHKICPYYLAQEMTRWSDLVVGDVNHYFDRQAILFSLTQQNDWQVVPLVDEAHNLIDRARGMYSAQLDRALFSKALKDSKSAQSAPEPLRKPIQAVQQGWRKLIAEEAAEHLDEAGSLISDQTFSDKAISVNLDQVPEQLNSYLHQLVTAITDYMTEYQPSHRQAQLLGYGEAQPPASSEQTLQQLLFDTLSFLKLAELFDQHSLCTLELSKGNPKFREPKIKAALKIQNLIPADFLRERFNRAYATVLFSATLSPAEYYRDLLGMAGSQVEASAVTESEPNQESDQEPVSEPTREALWLSLPGPFQSHQLDLRRVSVSTRFRDRNRSVPPICQRIAAQYRQKPGNYLVYLSSFSYLQQLHNGLTEYCPEIPLQVQSAGMKEAERQHFINRFRNEQGLVGLAVLGGAFSEGIDLPGDALIGVFVATLGLPPYDDFHETLSQRLEQRFGDGYRYTYLYPGLRKVIQAAGRLIRSPEDYGVIELIDDRFMQPEIQALLPDWWD